MRLIIAGTRTFDDYELLKEEVSKYIHERILDTDEEVIIFSGMASGADTLGEQFAEEKGFELKEFPANWNFYGKRAGYLRNEQMAREATHCIVFWDGESKGTKHMMDLAIEYKLELVVINYKELNTEDNGTEIDERTDDNFSGESNGLTGRTS